MANRLYAQYRDKSTAVGLSNIPLDFRQQIVNAANFVRDSYDIDSNNGEALNVIGRVVDRDRGFIETINFEVYQMNDIGDYEMGDDSIQMSPLSVTGDADLSDQYYRYLLKSKIVKNNSDATIDDILTAINTAIPGINALRLVDGEDMTFSIEFYGEIDAIARDLLLSGDLTPRPQGVKFNGFLEGAGIVEMNDEGDFEMGDESTEMVGFIGV
jgi:hypothetical protein